MAWAVALPITIHHFGVVSPWAVPLSVAALPLVSLLLGVGYAKMLLTPLLPSAGLLAGVALTVLADVLVSVVSAVDALPGSVFFVPRPSGVWALAAEGWVIAWALGAARRRRRAWAAVGGGLALWLALADAVGLDRAEVESCANVLPGVREVCDAYVHFVESHDLLESVAASLTELFAGDIMTTRIAAFEKHYPWVEATGLHYFRSRTRQAPRDAAEGLKFVLDAAQTDADRERCVAALERKCEILWSLLDAIESSHAVPVPSPHAQIRADEADGAMLVVLPERAVKLNDSGREILDLCDGERSAEAIAGELRRRHRDVEGVEADVHVFLARMRGLGVLTGGRGGSA